MTGGERKWWEMRWEEMKMCWFWHSVKESSGIVSRGEAEIIKKRKFQKRLGKRHIINSRRKIDETEEKFFSTQMIKNQWWEDQNSVLYYNKLSSQSESQRGHIRHKSYCSICNLFLVNRFWNTVHTKLD